MRAKRDKQLRKFAKAVGKPYKSIKRAYKLLNITQRLHFLDKMKNLI